MKTKVLCKPSVKKSPSFRLTFIKKNYKKIRNIFLQTPKACHRVSQKKTTHTSEEPRDDGFSPQRRARFFCRAWLWAKGSCAAGRFRPVSPAGNPFSIHMNKRKLNKQLDATSMVKVWQRCNRKKTGVSEFLVAGCNQPIWKIHYRKQEPHRETICVKRGLTLNVNKASSWSWTCTNKIK